MTAKRIIGYEKHGLFCRCRILFPDAAVMRGSSVSIKKQNPTEESVGLFLGWGGRI